MEKLPKTRRSLDELRELLVQHGAKTEIRSAFGETSEELARARGGDFAKLLKRRR